MPDYVISSRLFYTEKTSSWAWIVGIFISCVYLPRYTRAVTMWPQSPQPSCCTNTIRAVPRWPLISPSATIIYRIVNHLSALFLRRFLVIVIFSNAWMVKIYLPFTNLLQLVSLAIPRLRRNQCGIKPCQNTTKRNMCEVVCAVLQCLRAHQSGLLST